KLNPATHKISNLKLNPAPATDRPGGAGRGDPQGPLISSKLQPKRTGKQPTGLFVFSFYFPPSRRASTILQVMLCSSRREPRGPLAVADQPKKGGHIELLWGIAGGQPSY